MAGEITTSTTPAPQPSRPQVAAALSRTPTSSGSGDGAAAAAVAKAAELQDLAPADGKSAAEAVAEQAKQQAEKEPAVDREALEEAVARVKEHIKIVKREFNFSVDEVTGRTIVQVFDPENGELVRQIPPEEILAASHAIALLNESIGSGAFTGLLVREDV